MQNLWKDDRPGRLETKDICALASNKITPSASLEGKETKTSQNPDLGGEGTFQAASTSRGPLEAEIFKPPGDLAVGGLFKQSYIHSFSFQEDSLDSDDSQMPDVSC